MSRWEGPSGLKSAARGPVSRAPPRGCVYGPTTRAPRAGDFSGVLTRPLLIFVGPNFGSGCVPNPPLRFLLGMEYYRRETSGRPAASGSLAREESWPLAPFGAPPARARARARSGDVGDLSRRAAQKQFPLWGRGRSCPLTSNLVYGSRVFDFEFFSFDLHSKSLALNYLLEFSAPVCKRLRSQKAST